MWDETQALSKWVAEFEMCVNLKTLPEVDSDFCGDGFGLAWFLFFKERDDVW